MQWGCWETEQAPSREGACRVFKRSSPGRRGLTSGAATHVVLLVVGIIGVDGMIRAVLMFLLAVGVMMAVPVMAVRAV